MSTNNSPNSSNDSMTRRQRRAVERAARKNSTAKPSSSGSSGGSGPSMLLISIGAIAIGLVAVAALVILSGGLGGDEAAAVSKPVAAAPAEELRQGRTLVAPDTAPPVTIDVYEDPQCPACGLFTSRIEPLLISEYVEDGTASFTYNDLVFLGDESWDAAAAMRVAEDMDGKFWDYHQVLYHNQSGENGGAFSSDRLADLAELIGLDRAEFLELLDDPEYREAIEAENAVARGLGLGSTPSIIVNGEVITGVPTWDDFDAAIQEAAAEA